MKIFPTFRYVREAIEHDFLDRSYEVRPGRWQGVDVSSKPEMAMRELLNYSFQISLRGIEGLEYWAQDTGANLPFADVHFEERVGGEPTNPGEAWKIWPWGNNAAKFLEHEGRQFSHTYQERFWPKHAGWPLSSKLGRLDTIADSDWNPLAGPNTGIRYEYADLLDLVDHFAKDPLSRQAYVPIWFPEDGTCPGRKPCTLGYHFIQRHDFLHVAYFIRSCDFVRHFSDDCYLTIRLLLWVLDQLRKVDEGWRKVKVGMFSMHVVSLHMFANDFIQLRGRLRKAVI